jgi:hypothetical protein
MLKLNETFNEAYASIFDIEHDILAEATTDQKLKTSDYYAKVIGTLDDLLSVLKGADDTDDKDLQRLYKFVQNMYIKVNDVYDKKYKDAKDSKESDGVSALDPSDLGDLVFGEISADILNDPNFIKWLQSDEMDGNVREFRDLYSKDDVYENLSSYIDKDTLNNIINALFT